MKIEASLLWLHLRPVGNHRAPPVWPGVKTCYQKCTGLTSGNLASNPNSATFRLQEFWQLTFPASRRSHLTGMIISMRSMEHNVNVKLLFSCSVLSDSLRPHGLWPSRLLCPWDSPGKNIGVGCHFLLQGIFLMQGSNLHLLHCRWILYPLSHQFKLIHVKMNSYCFSW